MNILIPNIGRRGYLVQYLKQLNDHNIKVYVSDCNNTASGLYRNNDGAYILPKPVDNEEQYIDSLLSLCSELNIKIIIPVIDPEIFILSKYRDRFIANGVFISVSSSDVLNICYNKLEMNRFLSAYGFDFPRTYESVNDYESDLNRGLISFPAIIKPVFGSGSESTYKISDMNEAKALFHDGMIIQEFIEGQEYGIDIFNNIERKPVRCVIKNKISMRSGETDKSVTVSDPDIQTKAIKLGESLGHICNLDCDIIVKNKIIYFLDLNPRFGGGYPATHESGVNLLKLVIEMAYGKEILPVFNNYMTGIYTFKEISVVSTKELI